MSRVFNNNVEIKIVGSKAYEILKMWRRWFYFLVLEWNQFKGTEFYVTFEFLLRSLNITLPWPILIQLQYSVSPGHRWFGSSSIR